MFCSSRIDDGNFFGLELHNIMCKPFRPSIFLPLVVFLIDYNTFAALLIYLFIRPCFYNHKKGGG